MRPNRVAHRCRTLTLFALATLLSACGGTTEEDPLKPGETGLRLSGVVAQAKALPGALVKARCAQGDVGDSATAVADADGAYTLRVLGGQLPCLLEVVALQGSVRLHAALPLGADAPDDTAAAGSRQARAHVTPLTSLQVAHWLGTDAHSVFVDDVRMAQLSTLVTAQILSEARQAVLASLNAAGVDTSAVSDPVSDPLKAAHGTVAGDAHGQLLETLSLSLAAAGTTFPELRAQVAQASAERGLGLLADVAVKPLGAARLTTEALLKPKAPTCAALRSGPYRWLQLTPGPLSDGQDIVQTRVMTLEAHVPRSRWQGQPEADSVTWTPHAKDACRFTTAYHADIVVSPAGVVVMRRLLKEEGRASTRLAIAFPEQAVAVADLAGEWNAIGWIDTPVGGASGSPWSHTGVMSRFTLDRQGQMTREDCLDDPLSTPAASCRQVTGPHPVISGDAKGGLRMVSERPHDRGTARVFAYRAGNGAVMMLRLHPSGDFSWASRVRAATLPAVGDVQTHWNLRVNADGRVSEAMTATTGSVSSVDAATGVVVRSSLTAGDTTANAQQHTLTMNSSREGYWHRRVTAGKTAGGASYSVRAQWALPLDGMGLVPSIWPADNSGSTSNALFQLSVSPPGMAPAGVSSAIGPATLLDRYAQGTKLDRAALAYLSVNPSGLLGAWSFNSPAQNAPTIVFFASGDYVLLDPLGDAPGACGRPGAERGDFVFQGGVLRATAVAADTNGCAGLNNPDRASGTTNASWQVTFSPDGLTADAVERGSSPPRSITLYRLPQ
ncbi:MAG: hypothetical protein ACK57J_03490 [Rubrivivax sp.]